MPRSEEQNRRIREIQRKKILSAAKEAFLRKGHATTMADIAAAAKVSQGLAYRYFESKDAIFLELMQQMAAGDLFGIQRVRQAGGTATARLEMAISGLLSRAEGFEITIQAVLGGHTLERPFEFFHAAFRNMRNGSREEQEVARMMEEQFHEVRTCIREIIREGQKTGEFTQEDPEKLMILVLTSIKGLASFAIHRPEEFKAYAPYTDFILRILKT